MERESVSEGERDGDSVRECASERERSERCQVRARGRRSGGARGWETAQSAARKGLSADSGAPRGGEGEKLRGWSSMAGPRPGSPLAAPQPRGPPVAERALPVFRPPSPSQSSACSPPMSTARRVMPSKYAS